MPQATAASSAARSTPLWPPEITMKLDMWMAGFNQMRWHYTKRIGTIAHQANCRTRDRLDVWVVRGYERVGQCTSREKVFSSSCWSVLLPAGSPAELSRAVDLA